MADLNDLLARVEAASGPDRALDAEVALALGYTRRRVTRLGLNGRTPGRLEWFRPYPDATQCSLPSLTGHRNRSRTIDRLHALKDKTHG